MSPRRPGRRPGVSDTRERILAAARTEFAGNGYDAVSLRGIARSAGVDPALVHHYFGAKDKLLVEALALPFSPDDIVPRILDGPLEDVGERLTSFFLSVWESAEGRERMLAVLRSAVANEQVAAMFRGFVERELVARVAAGLGVPDAGLRATLAASQLVGMAMVRYVVRVEPLASADPEAVVAHLAPVIQRHLTGTWPAARSE